LIADNSWDFGFWGLELRDDKEPEECEAKAKENEAKAKELKELTQDFVHGEESAPDRNGSQRKSLKKFESGGKA